MPMARCARSLDWVDDIAGAAPRPAGRARLRALGPAALPAVAGTPRTGPRAGRGGQVICIGVNRTDHAAEAGPAVPAGPAIFMKATGTICGPEDTMPILRRAQDRPGSRAGRRHRPWRHAPMPRRLSPAIASRAMSRNGL